MVLLAAEFEIYRSIKPVALYNDNYNNNDDDNNINNNNINNNNKNNNNSEKTIHSKLSRKK